MQYFKVFVPKSKIITTQLKHIQQQISIIIELTHMCYSN